MHRSDSRGKESQLRPAPESVRGYPFEVQQKLQKEAIGQTKIMTKEKIKLQFLFLATSEKPDQEEDRKSVV